MEPGDLEGLIDRELKRLPVPRAPRALLPRVMAAVSAPRALPWYSRPWLSWPVSLKAASAVAFVAAGLGFWRLWIAAPQIVQWANQMTAVSRAFWNVLFGPIALVVLGLTVVVVLACAAAWTAVSRVTFSGVGGSPTQ